MEIVGFFEAIIQSDLKQPLLEKHDQTSQRSHAPKKRKLLNLSHFKIHKTRITVSRLRAKD